MATIIEVKYFNSFILKKLSSQLGNKVPVYNGSRGIPQIIGGYNLLDTATDIEESSSWTIEEARIRGGYNNTSTDYGVRAYATSEEPKGAIRGNTLIYSGIFNSRTGINQTNVFSVGEDITKSLDPVNGTIQRLYAEDTNLNIFQENKVSRALIDKDAIYSAEGGGSITSANLVIGQIVPYAGEFGISKNPESFAVYGYRKYFTDKDRNAVLRLSGNGIEEISIYGMYDYFRDEFNSIDTPGLPGRLTGGWDIHNKQYVICSQTGVNSASNRYNTVAFDESVNGWTSFFTYKPDWILSLRNKMYTLKDSDLYEHYSNNVNRGNFYGVDNNTSITFILNPAANYSKTFKTINYEGSNGWEVNSIISDSTGRDILGGSEINTFDSINRIYSYREGEYVINPTNGQAVTRADYQSVFNTDIPGLPRYHAGFDRKENKYVANLVNSSVLAEGQIRGGRDITGIKAYYATVTVSTDDTTDLGGAKELFSVGASYIQNNGY